VRSALWRAAEILAAEDEVMASLVPSFGAAEGIAVVALKELPVALQRRTLHAWLRRAGVANVDFEDVENVRRLLTQTAPAKVNLSGGMHVRRRAGRIFLDGA